MNVRVSSKSTDELFFKLLITCITSVSVMGATNIVLGELLFGILNTTEGSDGLLLIKDPQLPQ